MSSMQNHKRRSHRSESAHRSAVAGMTQFSPRRSGNGMVMALARPSKHKQGHVKLFKSLRNRKRAKPQEVGA